MPYRKSAIILSLLAVFVSSFIGGSAHATSGPYSTADIEQKLRNGAWSAVSWDTGCYNYLQNHSASAFSGDLRSWINASPSYVDDTWLSQQGRGNISVPITVNESDTSLGLQINNATFLCGSLVSPDLAGTAGGGCNGNIHGWDILNDSSRWVKNPTDVKDRKPNLPLSGCMYPSQTSNVTKITALSVESDTTYAGSVSNQVGAMINKSRDENSRYWFGNEIPVTYFPSGGFTKNGQIHLKMQYKVIRIFRGTTIQCASGKTDAGSPWDVAIADIDQCRTETRDLLVNVQLRQQFTLTPTISVNPQIASDSATVSIAPKVDNAGPTATLDSPEWRVTRFIVDPNGNYAPKTAANNASNPCAAISGYKVGTCQLAKSGNRNFGVGPTDLGGFVENTGALPIGSKICYVLSVKPYKSSIDQWAHSAASCTIIAKQPKVQIWGGDLYTRGKIVAQTTTMTIGGADKLFGSWVEYGGFSANTNKEFASGAGLNNGSATIATVAWNKLTFANIDKLGDGTYGRYALGPVAKVTDQFVGIASSGTFNPNLGTLNSGTYQVGSITIDPSVVGQSAGRGKSIIIVSSGTVKIVGDITYSAPSGDMFTSVGQIPQVVIIANNITIAGGVGRVDAWLLTTGDGAINTCSDVPLSDPLNAGVCKNPLTVNGPVATQHLHLRRTAGSDSVATAGTPAEVFNLRADAYVWAQARASQAGKAQTVYSVELPPRF